jgi:hypothetical protein
MTNADVRTVDDRTAQVFSYALPYRHELAEPDQHPVPLHGPSALLVVRDTYERHDGLWLLARKESRRVMVAG